jgi:gamma-glutamylcyclotransferase
MAESILYFAYGSNMMTRRLRKRTPSAHCEGTGFVRRHRLTFDKVSTDGSAKCDLEPTENETDRTYGVLFRIRAEEEPALDAAEGLGKGYRKDQVSVITANGETTALAYLATDKNPAARPYHWYKAMVIAGAMEHTLPDSYIEWLRTAPSDADPKPDRRAENEALLFGSS